jgi:hypothetical protein
MGALSLLLAGGCGSVSLDASSPSGTGSSTGGVTSTPTSTDGTGSSGAEPPPDLPMADVPEPSRPPVGTCPAECAVDLPLVWAYDEDWRPPLDGDGGHLATMARAPDGSLVVAGSRDGQPWLTRLLDDGTPQWTTPIELSCDCEIVDLAFTPLGLLFLLGQGSYLNGAQLLVVGCFELGNDTASPHWIAWDVLYGTPSRPGRVGSVLPLGESTVALPVIESGLGGGELDKDWFEILYYSDAQLESLWLVDTQLASGPPRRPRGAVLSDGRLATALAGSTAKGDYVVWLDPWSSFALAVEPLPGPIDAMVGGPDATLVVAGARALSPGQTALAAAGLPALDPPAWQLATDVATTPTDAPALAVDAQGGTYLALRTTVGAPDDPTSEVSLWRLAPDGTPLWSTTLPLTASERVALAIADHDLVLAAIVDGHLHVERREQGCRCD